MDLHKIYTDLRDVNCSILLKLKQKYQKLIFLLVQLLSLSESPFLDLRKPIFKFS